MKTYHIAVYYQLHVDDTSWPHQNVYQVEAEELEEALDNVIHHLYTIDYADEIGNNDLAPGKHFPTYQQFKMQNCTFVEDPTKGSPDFVDEEGWVLWEAKIVKL